MYMCVREMSNPSGFWGILSLPSSYGNKSESHPELKTEWTLEGEKRNEALSPHVCMLSGG